MTAIHETAYPRIRSNVTEKELIELYTPSQEQLEFADRNTRGKIPKLGLLILLKVFQRLGYFPMLQKIPQRVIRHIANCASLEDAVAHLGSYEETSTRRKHLPKIRDFWGIKEFRRGGEEVLNQTLISACQTKDIIADIINIGIEELVHHRYELPAFSNLVSAARKARLEVNRGFYQDVTQSLSEAHKAMIRELMSSEKEESISSWQRLKQEPKRVTVKNMHECIKHLHWLKSLEVTSEAMNAIPEAKFQRFASEAFSLNVNEMNDLPEAKRYTLAAALVRTQTAQAIDDLTDMFIRSVQKLHNCGRDALDEYHRIHREKTDYLIETLFNMLGVVSASSNAEEQMNMIKEILGDETEQIAEACENYLGYAKNNYIPFLPKFYKSRRRNFFEFLAVLQPKSTSSDKTLEEAIHFLLQHRNCRAKHLEVTVVDKESGKERLLDLSWLPPKWWKMVTGTTKRDLPVEKVDRRYFEICLFSCVMLELKSGDLFIEWSEKYGDYTTQLISWEEYQASISTYCEQTGFSIDADEFVSNLKTWLASTVLSVDASFPENESVLIENGKPVIKRLTKREKPKGLDQVLGLLEQRLPVCNITDVLSDTEHWLNWTQHFHPISGYETKLLFPQQRYITTTFCYGCNLGPTQTARSMADLGYGLHLYEKRR